MTHEPYHFRLIARAIEHIGETVADQPGLDEIAAAAGLSPAHFQRVFSRWAGVSPKRFQQFVTLCRARDLLARRHTVLDTAHATGLSGTGRLHDLFLTWEAMSPGEYARRGDGLLIHYGWHDSPFGDMLVMGTGRGICGLGFAADSRREDVLADLAKRWPGADYAEDREKLSEPVSHMLSSSGSVRLQLIGGPFQIKVWEALLQIPSGRVTTYSDVARHVGNPRAVRAVGNAVGRNPVSWLIPCHRVLRLSGHMGGYHWGLSVKQAMLAREAVRCEADGSAP